MCHQAASPHHYTDNSHTWGSRRWCDYESPVRCWPGQMMSMVTQSVVIESKNIEDCQHCNVNCWKKSTLNEGDWQIDIKVFWGRVILYDAMMKDRRLETCPMRRPMPVDTCFLFADWLAPAPANLETWSVSWGIMSCVMSWGDMIQPDMGSEIIYTLGQEMQANLTNWDLSLSLTYHHLTIITMSMSASLFKLLLNAGMCP